MPPAGASDKIGRGKDDSAAKPSCSLQTIPANNSHVGARVDIFGKENFSLALLGHDAEVTTSWTAYDSPLKFVINFVTNEETSQYSRCPGTHVSVIESPSNMDNYP